MACLLDFEERAKELLPRAVEGYFRGQMGRGVTLRDNEDAFQRYFILPRMLRDVSTRDLTTTILGHTVSYPVCISPTAYMGLAHPEGELAVARAAAAAGTIYTQSTLSNHSVADVTRAAPEGLRFFQLYVHRGRQSTVDLVRLAERHGYKAIVLTIDTPLATKRVDDVKTGFCLPPHLSLPNVDHLHMSKGKVSNVTDYASDMFDPSLDWDSLKWIKSITSLPLVVKGILTAEAATRAVECGVDAILVSNHGARNLDTVPATIDVLPSVIRAVGGRCEVYVDSGVRQGTDVFKALAMGARAAFIGRPIIHGLTCHGEAGVKKVLDILREEFDGCMGLAGCRNISEIDDSLVVHRSKFQSRL